METFNPKLHKSVMAFLRLGNSEAEAAEHFRVTSHVIRQYVAADVAWNLSPKELFTPTPKSQLPIPPKPVVAPRAIRPKPAPMVKPRPKIPPPPASPSKTPGANVSAIWMSLRGSIAPVYGMQEPKADLREFRRVATERPEATHHELAKMFGVSATTVQKYLKRLNIPRAPRRYQPPKVSLDVVREELAKWPDATQKELGKMLGVSGTVMGTYFKKLGITRTRPLGFDVEEFRQEIEKNPNITREGISKKLGMADSTVRKYLKDLNLTLKYAPRPRRFDREELLKELKKHPKLSVNALAKKFGVVRGSVQKCLKNLGIVRQPQSYTKYHHKLETETLRQKMEERPDLTKKELAKIFGVCAVTIDNVLKRMKAGPKPVVEPPRKLDLNALQQKMEQRPNIMQKELAEFFGVSTVTIRDGQKRLKARLKPPPASP